jgi:hypothetical protein
MARKLCIDLHVKDTHKMKSGALKRRILEELARELETEAVQSPLEINIICNQTGPEPPPPPPPPPDKPPKEKRKHKS